MIVSDAADFLMLRLITPGSLIAGLRENLCYYGLDTIDSTVS